MDPSPRAHAGPSESTGPPSSSGGGADSDPAGSLDPALRAWLHREVGEVRVLGELRGGITARMLRLRRPGGGDLVLRRWSGEDPGEREAVGREVAGLGAPAA